MLLNVKFKIVALFMLLLNIPGVSNEQSWVRRLIKHIEKDVPVFQTVLIIGEDVKSQDKRITHIAGKILQEIPSQVIKLTATRGTRVNTSVNTSSFLNQSFVTTSLFITIPFIKKGEELQTTDTTDFLNQLSAPKARPKCLMIALSKMRGKLNYRKLLRNMWSNYFLDFTILEIAEIRVEKSSLVWNRHQFVTKVYYFNPFNEISTEKNYTKTTKLFPNKLLDLNGFEMKVGSFNLPPHLYVKRNSTGYPVEVSGQDALLAKALSKEMNFRLSEVPLHPSQEEWFGHWNCDDDSNRTGFAYLLGNNSIRFVTNQGGMVPKCEKQSLDIKSAGAVNYCALIPMFTSIVKSDVASPTSKWIYFLVLVIIIRITTILLKFDNDVWSWSEILQISLGFGVPREPSRLSERIVFFSILIAFSIFSSNIFAMLTDTKLTKKSEMPIDTLEELNRTNLSPMTTESNLDVMKELTEDPVMQALAAKSKIILQNDECINILVQGEDVACIIRESTALVTIREHRDENNDPVMKILKERLFFPRKVIFFEPNSPYGRQVDKIISRLVQSGLMYHWEKQTLPPLKKSNQWETEEELGSIVVLVPLIFFISFGCSFSIVVFICEFLIKYFDNRIHGVFLFFSQGSVL